MNLLFVANGYPPTAYGGAELYVADLAQELRAQGDRVAVLCAESRTDLPDGHIIEDTVAGIPVYRVVNTFKRLHTFRDLFTDDRIDAHFEALLLKVQPDLVHFNHLIGLSANLPHITRRRGTPALFTAHDFWPLCQRVYLLDWRRRTCPGPAQGGDCYRCVTSTTPSLRARTLAGALLRAVLPAPLRERTPFLARQATPARLANRAALFRESLAQTAGITTPSHFVKAMFARNGYPTERIDVLPLGLEHPGEHAREKTSAAEVRVAVIASLITGKGVDVLLRAFRAVGALNLRLSLYGRDDIEPAYARKLRQLAAGDPRIVFAGLFAPEQKDAIYRHIDLLVIPSLGYESFSLVAREALLRGTPVIASANGALPEIIRDGQNGFLFAPGDASALAGILRRIAAAPRRLAQLDLPGPVTILTRAEHAARIRQRYIEIVEHAI